MVEMETADERALEKLARVPEAPAPVFWYSPYATLLVLSSPVFQTDHPAELMTDEIVVFWNTTRE